MPLSALLPLLPATGFGLPTVLRRATHSTSPVALVSAKAGWQSRPKLFLPFVGKKHLASDSLSPPTFWDMWLVLGEHWMTIDGGTWEPGMFSKGLLTSSVEHRLLAGFCYVLLTLVRHLVLPQETVRPWH